MRKKILFAVMALLTIAPGKIWAAETGEGGTTTDNSTAYVVLCNDNSLHFLCSNEILAKGGTLSENGKKISEVWSGDEVLKTGASAPEWWIKSCSVTSVVIDKSFENARPMSCYKWFCELSNECKTIEGIEHLNTSEVTNMRYMFSVCSELTSLNLSSFDTSNVTDMRYMFSNCIGLTSLDISNFNTSNVTNMQQMFYGCSSLSLLDLSKAENSDDPTKKTISDMIGTLPDNVYPVIFVSTETTVPGGRKNVISKDGDECESLLIDANNITTLSLPYSFTAKSVTFKRSFAAGKAHTICLPFAVSSATDDYKLYEYDAYKDGIVKFKDAPSTTEPHKPYLLVPNKTLEEITVENAAISATTSEAAAAEEEGFFGVYKKMVFTAEVLGGDYDYYGWTGNTDGNGEFRKAGEGAYVNACRAYIKLKNVSGNNAPARLSIELGDGTTGIGSAKSDADGGMEAPMYNLQGQRVGSGYKGVVIKNGKKMIVK